MTTFALLDATGPDAARWQTYFDRLPQRDVMFSPAYMRVQALTPLGGFPKLALFEEEGRFAMQPFLMRSAPNMHVDFSTPYGLGGIVTSRDRPGLWARFEAEFAKHRSANVVCEFCAEHPLINMVRPEGGEQTERTVIVALVSLSDDALWGTLSESRRRDIDAARRRGMAVECSGSMRGYDLGVWRVLYQAMLDRQQAARRYYYADHVWEAYRDELWPEHCSLLFQTENGRACAAMLMLHGYGIAHVHFVASTQASTDLLYWEALRHARTVGCDTVILGGGRTEAADDSLLAYKAKFGSPVVMRTWRRIFDPHAYQECCAEAGVQPGSGFFPAYRRAA